MPPPTGLRAGASFASLSSALPDGETTLRTRLQRRVTTLALLASTIFIVLAGAQGGLLASYQLQQSVRVYFGLYSTVFALILVLVNLMLFSLRGATAASTGSSGPAESRPMPIGQRTMSSPAEDIAAAAKPRLSGDAPKAAASKDLSLSELDESSQSLKV